MVKKKLPVGEGNANSNGKLLAEVEREKKLKDAGAAHASVFIDQAAKMFYQTKKKQLANDQDILGMLFGGMIHVMSDFLAHCYMCGYYKEPIKEVEKFSVQLYKKTMVTIAARQAAEGNKVKSNIIVPGDKV